MKNILILFFLITSIRVNASITMETLVSIEDDIYDIQYISVLSFHNDSLQSTLLTSNFGNVLNGPNGLYRPNLDLFLDGSGLLNIGVNKLIITLSTMTGVYKDTFDVNIDSNVSRVEVKCLIGKSTNSISYVKDFTVKRIVNNPSGIVLLPKMLAMDTPLDILICNHTSDTIYGNSNGNHFVAELKMKKGLGYGMYDFFRPCVPKGRTVPLFPSDSTRLQVNDEKNCTNIAID
ncbi:MAG: hypothetical protein IT222_09885, partial [Crocinitomix sp.]|nr:hypothetical protein [Crocinitomix sp.]